MPLTSRTSSFGPTKNQEAPVRCCYIPPSTESTDCNEESGHLGTGPTRPEIPIHDLHGSYSQIYPSHWKIRQPSISIAFIIFRTSTLAAAKGQGCLPSWLAAAKAGISQTALPVWRISFCQLTFLGFRWVLQLTVAALAATSRQHLTSHLGASFWGPIPEKHSRTWFKSEVVMVVHTADVFVDMFEGMAYILQWVGVWKLLKSRRPPCSHRGFTEDFPKISY